MFFPQSCINCLFIWTGYIGCTLTMRFQLFVIEGDFIHLREGAQEIISATTAFAKVAAAAAASSTPLSSLFPSVALTPVAQSNRHKTVPSLDSKPSNTSFLEGVAASKSGDSCDKRSQISKHNQQPNDVSFNMAKGISDMNISVKSKNLQEVNGLASEIRPHSSGQSAVGNGANKGLSNGRLSSGGKQQARYQFFFPSHFCIYLPISLNEQAFHHIYC